MSGHRPFKELEDKMSPQSRARVHAKVKEAEAQMLLAGIQKLTGEPQEEFARILGVKPLSPADLEAHDDMHVATLRRLVEALGGELEIVIHMPGSDLRIRQFKDAS